MVVIWSIFWYFTWPLQCVSAAEMPDCFWVNLLIWYFVLQNIGFLCASIFSHTQTSANLNKKEISKQIFKGLSSLASQYNKANASILYVSSSATRFTFNKLSRRWPSVSFQYCYCRFARRQSARLCLCTRACVCDCDCVRVCKCECVRGEDNLVRGHIYA